MRFNNVVCALRSWCAEASERYREEAEGDRQLHGATNRYAKVRFAEEMQYKLGTLIDREFEDFENMKAAVREMVSLRILYALVQERNAEALTFVKEAEDAFRGHLEHVAADVSSERSPYYRVIMGDERDSLAYAILEKWDYSTAYWYPFCGGSDESKLYLDAGILEPYMERLLELLGLPEKRVYEYGESWYVGEHCAEVDDLYGYRGNEAVYVPKDLSWIIYFSHEGTVTFGGTIVPAVKELLKDEMEHWNQY